MEIAAELANAAALRTVSCLGKIEDVRARSGNEPGGPQWQLQIEIGRDARRFGELAAVAAGLADASTAPEQLTDVATSCEDFAEHLLTGSAEVLRALGSAEVALDLARAGAQLTAAAEALRRVHVR